MAGHESSLTEWFLQLHVRRRDLVSGAGVAVAG